MQEQRACSIVTKVGSTFEEFAAVDLAGSDLECDAMTLVSTIMVSFCFLLSKSRNNPQCGPTCASLSSLMGMPIVDVSLPILFEVSVEAPTVSNFSGG